MDHLHKHVPGKRLSSRKAAPLPFEIFRSGCATSQVSILATLPQNSAPKLRNGSGAADVKNRTDISRACLHNSQMGGRSGFLFPLAIAFSVAVAISLFVWLFPPTIWFSAPPDRCPKCQSKDIRRSMVMGFRDRLRVVLQVRPFRCRGCWTRFSAKAGKEAELAERV